MISSCGVHYTIGVVGKGRGMIDFGRIQYIIDIKERVQKNPDYLDNVTEEDVLMCLVRDGIMCEAASTEEYWDRVKEASKWDKDKKIQYCKEYFSKTSKVAQE